MTLEFRREKLFPDLFGELHALLKRHWNEVALREVTGPLDIDEDMYRLLEANGNLILITARERGAGPGASADSAAVSFAAPGGGQKAETGGHTGAVGEAEAADTVASVAAHDALAPCGPGSSVPSSLRELPLSSAAPRDTEAGASAAVSFAAPPEITPMPAAPAAVSFAAPGGGQKAEAAGHTEFSVADAEVSMSGETGKTGAAGEQRAEKAGETGKAEAAGAAGDEAERYEGQSRGRGILAGYAAYFLTPNLHYRSRLVAEADVFYLAPEYRRGLAGLRLLQAAERECIRAGAHIIQNKVKIAHDCGRLFERMGYRAAEKLYVKAVAEPHAPEED